MNTGPACARLRRPMSSLLHARISIRTGCNSSSSGIRPGFAAEWDAFGDSLLARAHAAAHPSAAAQKKTLDDIELQELSSDDRRILFQHAVLLTFADGKQSHDEVELLTALAKKLRIPNAETALLMAAGAERAKKHLQLL